MRLFSEKKTKVLVADDNKINVRLLKTILETEYCEIETTENGLDTLDTLKNAVGYL